MDGESRNPTDSETDLVVYRTNPYASPEVDLGSLKNGPVVYRTNEDLCSATDPIHGDLYEYIDESQLRESSSTTSISRNDSLQYDDTTTQISGSLNEQTYRQGASQHDKIKAKCSIKKTISQGMVICILILALVTSITFAVIFKNQGHKDQSQEPMISTEEPPEVKEPTTANNLDATGTK